MKSIRWNSLKNRRLKETRGVSFEEILQAKLIAKKKHPQLAHQDVMLFYYRNYIWVVPYIKEENYLFLKTLYPSRQYTKMYKTGKLY